MTNEQKDRIVKLCERIGWPDVGYSIMTSDQRLILKGEDWRFDDILIPTPFAISFIIRWLAGKLIEAGCAIDLHRSGTRVTDNEYAQLSFNKDHLAALLKAAETKGILK